MSIRHTVVVTNLPPKPSKMFRHRHPHYLTHSTDPFEVRFVDKDHGYMEIYRLAR